MEREILANCAMAPDGTIIFSHNRHDYRTHETIDTWLTSEVEGEPATPADTRHTMVDGGQEYLRRGGKFTEMSVFTDDPYEIIRRFVCRGGRGKDLKSPLTYVPLMAMANDWLDAVIEYEEDLRPNNKYIKYYKKEIEYRKEHNIFIKDI